MPRLIDKGPCPHCGEPLPEPRPRVCPHCAGSIQQRYLKSGCLSSSPNLLLAGWALWRVVDALLGT